MQRVLAVSLAVLASACSSGGDDAAAGAGGASTAASTASHGSSTTSGTASASSSTASSTSTSGVGGAGGAGGGATSFDFPAPASLSDPANNAFVPSVGARDGQCLVAWHEFLPSGVAEVTYVLVEGGVAGPATVVIDPLNDGKQPWVAVTTQGYVVAYEANDGTTDVVRAVEIDASGHVIAGPDTVSMPGAEAAMPRVAAAGDEEAFSWTDGQKHGYAMRGPLETIGPSDVGTTLLAQSLLNFPRVALSPAGDLFLAYRDGGEDSTYWDVLLTVRPHGGVFGVSSDVSSSPGLLSDDISLALEADGTLDLAWVDQDALNIDAFEVAYATRAPSGALSTPARYGDQGMWAWTPSVVPGLMAVWTTGGAGIGPMWFGSPTIAPTSILGGAEAERATMALGPDGVLHLAYADDGSPAQIHYTEAAAP
jgi:hypothetical protein